MQQGDIIVVRLDSGPRLGRFIETKSNRVRLSIGRNREARLPVSRVIHETGLSASSHDIDRGIKPGSERGRQRD